MELTGQNLKKLRNKKGLTLTQAAEGVGVSISTIWYWEENKRTPNIWNAQELEKLYDVKFHVVNDNRKYSVKELIKIAEGNNNV